MSITTAYIHERIHVNPHHAKAWGYCYFIHFPPNESEFVTILLTTKHHTSPSCLHRNITPYHPADDETSHHTSPFCWKRNITSHHPADDETSSLTILLTTKHHTSSSCWRRNITHHHPADDETSHLTILLTTKHHTSPSCWRRIQTVGERFLSYYSS